MAKKKLAPGQWAVPGPDGVGMLRGPGTLFLRCEVGTARTEEDEISLACAGIGPGYPIVQSKKTGRFFALTWEDIIELAVAAGISDTKPPKKES